MLSEELFKKVVASTPMVSIDLIVRDTQANILLGKRVNRPAKDFWFVPRGRVLKDETIEQDFTRLLEVELGMNKISACFRGIYQHFTEENFTTHYIVLANEVVFTADMSLLPVAQHNDYRWFS
jgi:colanic acid biosynthesis protein WcaH